MSSSKKPSNHKRPQHNHSSNIRNSNAPETSRHPSVSRSVSDSSCDDYEIPGFYYDKEKKKYFKILPNCNNNTGVVTNASIRKAAEERTRLNAVHFPEKQKLSKSNIFNFAFHRTLFSAVPNWEVGVIKSRLTQLQVTKQAKLFPEPEYSYQSLDHMHAIVPNEDCTKLLGLWSLKGSLLQRIQTLKLSGISSLIIEPFGPVLMKSIAKVTHMVWAPIPTSKSTMLHTTMCLLGTSSSLALFRKLDSEDREDFISKEFNLGKNAAWTCAWNSRDQKFSVGSERKALLIDFRSRGMWELNTDSSDIYTQQFSSDNPNILYSGSKKGYLLLHDTRHSVKPSLSIKHKSPVCCVQLKKDENYIITENFKGQILLWDIRKCKKIMKYEGQVNEYTRLTFGIDENSDILYGAGQDSYTRIWSLNDGRLLKTLPPLHTASRDTIPSLCYSQKFAGRHHGLLMGTRDEIAYYSI